MSGLFAFRTSSKSSNVHAAEARSTAPIEFTKHHFALLIGVLLLAAGARVLFLPGFAGGDDVMYAHRATEIALGIWRWSDYFGELRYGINLPISFFVSIFGANLVGFVAWSFICSLAEIALVFVIAHYIWGLKAAVLAGFLIALTPIHINLGSSALGDAPLAFLFTLALVSFFFAERSSAKWLYFVTGVAVGFSWWIKPIAAVPFALTFAVYAVIWRLWRREWILAILGGGLTVCLELVMLWSQFGDPFHSIKANFSGVSHYFIQSNAPWGSHSPWFYFRQMFLDGRTMWIVPHFALVGLLFFAWDKRHAGNGNAGNGSEFVVFWAITLVSLFSFFVYSVNPVKFIPKQTNYALIFFAPVALLGGYALSRMNQIWLLGLICAFILGTLPLSALLQYGDRLNFSVIEKAQSFAKEHPEALVFTSHQAIGSASLTDLAVGQPGISENLRSIDLLSSGQSSANGDSNRLRFAIVDPLSPEFTQENQAKLIAKTLAKCWQRITSFRPIASGFGEPVVALMSQLRPLLPRLVDRHLSFTDKLISPPMVEIFQSRPDCNASGT